MHQKRCRLCYIIELLTDIIILIKGVDRCIRLISIYVDRHTRNKFEIFARNVDFADSLIKRINNLGVFSLRRARLHFYKVINLDIPPYELEQEQDRTVSDWEKKNNDNEKE